MHMDYLHSSLRYLILVFLVGSVAIALSKWMGKKPFTKGDKITYLMTLICCHLQLVVGIILFINKGHHQNFKIMGVVMKESLLRFITIEHPIMMLLSIVFITIGYSTAKRAKDDAAKHKKTFIFYLLGLILILAAIPWPFRFPSYNWF